MLKENQTVKVKWASTNKKWFMSKGYQFTKMGEEFYVPVVHLSEGVRNPVKVICDYCLENGTITEYEKPYFKYITHRKGLNKDSCMECRNIKQREVMFNRYGVTSPAQLPEVANKIKKARTLDFNRIIERFAESNCTLLSTESEYENNTSGLRFICNSHKNEGEQVRAWINISVSKEKICSFCSKDSRSEKLRTDFKIVKDEFTKNNLMLVDGQSYLNAQTKLDYICPKHEDKGIQQIDYTHLCRGQGCRYCYLENKSGENCNFWTGGTTEILHFLRGCLTEWRKDSLRMCNYKCIISGKKYVEVHHLYSFHLIVEEIIELLNLDIKKKVSDFTKEELFSLEQMCLELHRKYGLGVCLSPSIHDHFHKIYGNKNNNKEQFIEFINDFYKDSVVNLMAYF